MKAEEKRIIKLSDQLQEAASEIKVLRNISWPVELKQEFFRNDGQKLPEVEYPALDLKNTFQSLKTIRAELKENSNIDLWALRMLDQLEGSALMLEHRGTRAFYDHSSWVYGRPDDLIRNGEISALDLARHFDEFFENVSNHDIGDISEPRIDAKELVKIMQEVVHERFAEYAPEVVLDENIASNALAGRRRISIRPGAKFSENDVAQLINHELFIHVITSLNGFLQPHIKILGEAHAGTTKTQEGLAIFAEYITNSIDLDRIRRLADRVIAIHMAINGADFIEVYRYYLERLGKKDQAYESARRVFRGGLVTGGAPFTKDIVYLEGLLRVHSFMRIVVKTGKLDYLDLLFCGKLDIVDLPVMKELVQLGLVEKPRFLPDWMKDKRYLLTYLSYSAFLDGLNLENMQKDFQKLLDA